MLHQQSAMLQIDSPLVVKNAEAKFRAVERNFGEALSRLKG